MQLEELVTSLGITQHMEVLSNWRDALLVEKAAELKSVHDERDTIAAEFAAYKSTAKSALKAADDAIKNQDLNDKDTVATIAVIVAETAKPVAQREIEALQTEKARLEAELATKLAAL